jgi:hypothetical protein
LFAALLVAAIALLLFRVGHLNHDVAWLLVATERLVHGGRYFHDIVEPTPPLALFVMAPSLAIRDALGIGPYPAYMAWVGALIVASSVLCRPALHAALGRGADEALPEAWLVPAVLALFPGYDFGQKEHLFVILCTPAILLIAARGRAAAPYAATVLALAAVAVLIKPYWIVIPAAPALVALLQRRLERPFVMLAVAIGVTAAAAVASATVIWFGDWVRLVRVAAVVYGAYDSAPGGLIAFVAAHAAMVGMAWAAARRLAPGAAPVRDLLLAAAAAVAAALAQMKGWPYHFLPAVELCALAAALALVRRGRCAALPPRTGRAAAVTLAVLVAVMALAPYDRALSRDPPDVAEFRALARRHAAGERFLALSSDLWPAFPATVEIGAAWASRSPAQWFVPGAVRLLAGNADERARGERIRAVVFDMLAEDFARYRPTVLAVKVRPPFLGLPAGFDMTAFLRQDARLRAALDGYREVARGEAWVFYRRGG